MSDSSHRNQAGADQSGEGTALDYRVLIAGTRNWLPVAAELFRRAGIEHQIDQPPKRGALIRSLVNSPYTGFDAIHHVGGPWDKKIALKMGLARRPVVWHWIGSDWVNYRELQGTLNQWICRRAVHRRAAVHLADSPQLAQELRADRIEAQVVRLLPATIEAQPIPLPDRFAVLSYWSDARFEFYGGPIVMQLAEEFSDVAFHIVGATGQNVNAPDNVRFHGFVSDLSDIYRQSSVLIRLPEHDSLSAMVLEMLARGRYAIYNKPLEGCEPARSIEDVRAALERIRIQSTPNLTGARIVREQFSLDREAQTLRRIYDQLLGS